ncbi:MAG: HD domain-containing protein [Treponema sp.]|jgi:HD superfamily phosphohydrolase|nr:HD domain-containing protein [Treponema sp.]
MNNTIHAVLERNFNSPIRDVLWGHIYLSSGLEALSSSADFMRLHRILQLGPTHIVYPGATHTRAAHSIGVYHLARRLLIHLAGRGADSWLSAEGARSFLCAALLHDLGHFPYTHSLKELPLVSHEELTGKFILTEPMKSLVGDTGADPYMSAAIIDTSLPTSGNQELRFYRKLLSGALDPDKLDYLNRDARYCGVPYGAQDVDFILSRLWPDPEQGLLIDARAIPSVESVLFSKYLMYRAVYWHPAVRSATAMIKKTLASALKNQRIAREELYNLDDQGLFTLLAERAQSCGAAHGDPLFSLGAKVRDGRLYAVAAEFLYNEEQHQGLADIDKRYHVEQELAARLCIRPDELIIDVPEPISFETGLAIHEDKGHISTGVFTAETIDAFRKELRVVRVFVDPAHEKALGSMPEDIFNVLQGVLPEARSDSLSK